MKITQEFRRQGVGSDVVEAIVRLDDTRAVRIRFSHVSQEESPAPLHSDQETVDKIVALVKEMDLQIGDEIQTQGNRPTTRLLRNGSKTSGNLTEKNLSTLYQVYLALYPRGAMLTLNLDIPLVTQESVLAPSALPQISRLHSRRAQEHCRSL